MHTVSMTRGTSHTASFVLTSRLSSYQTDAFLIEREFLHSQTRDLAGRHVSESCILLREICSGHLEWIDGATNKSRRRVVLMLRWWTIRWRRIVLFHELNDSLCVTLYDLGGTVFQNLLLWTITTV